MQTLFRITFAAAFLVFGGTAFVNAQESVTEKVAGQDAIADVNELSDAIDLLYAYPVVESEIQDFYLTMTSLTAWARTHGFEWNGMIDSYPLLEALRGLTFWQTVGRSPEPFCTTFAKVSLLSNFADPEYDARDRAHEYLEHHQKLFEADEIAEEDVEMVQEGMALALEHLAKLNSIPEENRSLYIQELGKIDFLLEELPLMGLLPEQPDIAFRSSSAGLLMRATGFWSRSPHEASAIFNLADSYCSVGAYSVPWNESDTLNDALMDEIVAALTKQDSSLQVQERLGGEVNGRVDSRLYFQLDGNHPRGMVYATAVEDSLFILIFRYAVEEAGLLKPIIEECCANLEFGDYELPLLLDRSEVGYQVFAEDPWMITEICPPAADRSLTFGVMPLSLDIAIMEDIGFGLNELIEILPKLSDLTRDRFLSPLIEEPRIIEVDGLPCAVIRGSGVMLDSPDAFEGVAQVSVNYYILNGDRIVNIGALVAQEQWFEIGPMIESLVLNMDITQIAPRLGTNPLLLDRSEDGFVVFAPEPWEPHYNEPNDVWSLSHGNTPLNMNFFVHKDIESVSEQMEGIVQNALQGDLLWFEDPNVSEVTEVEVDGRTCKVFEMYGMLKSEYAKYPGEAEHFLSLFIPLDHQVLLVFIAAKHDSWKKSNFLAFELIGDIQFPTAGKTFVSYDKEVALLLDRAEVGYQVYANGLWRQNNNTSKSCDAGIVSENLGCFIDITVLGSIPEDRYEHFAGYVHKASLEQYIEPHTVDSGTFELGGRQGALSEIYGVQAEGNEYSGVDVHIRQLFLHYDQQVLFVSIRTKTKNWELAKPHIEELLKNLKLPDVPKGE